MLTSKKNKCVPEKREPGDTSPPSYMCLPNGDTYYFSKEEQKDYEYGGKCPIFCPIKSVKSSCPNVAYVADTTIARQQCEADESCQFIGNQVFDRYGPNYCVPKSQPGCITLTEADLSLSDKELTENPNFCDRLGKGCIFNRGNGDGDKTRAGEATCLRGCLGSKYWKNPEYMWGAGGTNQEPYTGSWDYSDLELGPKYLEAAPSASHPNGWGGPVGAPWFGHGILPKSLSIPYTVSQGQYSPPCNLNEGDVGVFTSTISGETLAGPGCMLTPPQPRFGLLEWSYTCNCPYLGGGGEFRADAWTPCADWENDESNTNERDVCEGCYIMDDEKDPLYGHCVLGEPTMDTESKKLGCVELPGQENKCRIRRKVEPTECPLYCKNDKEKQGDVLNWRTNTQCSKALSEGYWKLNPNYNKVVSVATAEDEKLPPPYIKTDKNGSFKKKDTMEDLCRNCSQTSVKAIGSGTKYPNRSYCVVGGSENASSLMDTGYGNYLARKLGCPATCKGCLSGFFGEPMEPKYNLSEASIGSSAFNKGILFVPAIVKDN